MRGVDEMDWYRCLHVWCQALRTKDFGRSAVSLYLAIIFSLKPSGLSDEIVYYPKGFSAVSGAVCSHTLCPRYGESRTCSEGLRSL